MRQGSLVEQVHAANFTYSVNNPQHLSRIHSSAEPQSFVGLETGSHGSGKGGCIGLLGT